MAVHGGAVEDASYETDRSRFIGRMQTVADPVALRSDLPLSNTQGSVLDPIVAIRRRITLEPQQTAIVDVVTGIAEDRARCIALIEKYQDLPLADRAFEMAWTHSQVVLRQLNITEKDAQLYARLSGSIIYAGASYRADGNVIARNRRNQSGLWGYAISGDLPIVLLQIKDPKNIELVRQLVQAHAYWRLKGLMVDLVIWNEERGGYRQQLHDQILGMWRLASRPTSSTARAESFCARPSRSARKTARFCNRSRARSSWTVGAAWPSRYGAWCPRRLR